MIKEKIRMINEINESINSYDNTHYAILHAFTLLF